MSVTIVRHDGPSFRDGWTCCNGLGLYCNEPAKNLVIDDGRWHYQAACDNEQHMAEAIQLDIEDRIEPGVPVEELT